MALTQKLQLRQSHALVMTPQLMQAIKLLQLSNLDLVGYVESELERNPLLERTGEVSGADDAEAVAPRASADASSSYTDWTGAGTGRQQDGEYNLEAFVSAER